MKTSASPDALPTGTKLNEFEIRSVIGVGGFSIVYLAYDTVLCREVAIKEYLPASLAVRDDDMQVVARISSEKVFEKGMRHFIREARILSRLKHAALATVLRFFEANCTAYLVMPYYRGKTLRVMIDNGYLIKNAHDLLSIFSPLLDGLSQIHAMGCYHLDISTDNIIILKNGAPILLDFGSSRVSHKSDSSTIILKHGFAPIEQYCNGENEFRLGPWSDIYALSAVMRYMITGKIPLTACSRIMEDTLQPLADLGIHHLPVSVLRAIDAGLAVRPEDRPQTIEAFSKAFNISGKSTTRRRTKSAPKSSPQRLPSMAATDSVGTSNLGSDSFFGKTAKAWKRFVATLESRIHFSIANSKTDRQSSDTTTSTAWRRYGFGAGIAVVALFMLINSYFIDNKVDETSSNENVAVQTVQNDAMRQTDLLSPSRQLSSSYRLSENQLSESRLPENQLSENVAVQEDNTIRPEYADTSTSTATPANRTLINNDIGTDREVVREAGKPLENASESPVGSSSHGQIVVTVRPWGHVSLDGKFVGTVPPRLVLNAREGNHIVTISNESNEICVLDVMVKKGKQMQVTHDFLAETPPAVLGSVAADTQRR